MWVVYHMDPEHKAKQQRLYSGSESFGDDWSQSCKPLSAFIPPPPSKKQRRIAVSFKWVMKNTVMNSEW